MLSSSAGKPFIERINAVRSRTGSCRPRRWRAAADRPPTPDRSVDRPAPRGWRQRARRPAHTAAVRGRCPRPGRQRGYSMSPSNRTCTAVTTTADRIRSIARTFPRSTILPAPQVYQAITEPSELHRRSAAQRLPRQEDTGREPATDAPGGPATKRGEYFEHSITGEHERIARQTSGCKIGMWLRPPAGGGWSRCGG